MSYALFVILTGAAAQVETAPMTDYDVFMTTAAEKLLQDAMKLSQSERAEVAAHLLATLEETEAEVEAAWAAEIQRRAADARANPDDDEDWRVVFDEIQREVLTR